MPGHAACTAKLRAALLKLRGTKFAVCAGTSPLRAVAPSPADRLARLAQAQQQQRLHGVPRLWQAAHEYATQHVAPGGAPDLARVAATIRDPAPLPSVALHGAAALPSAATHPGSACQQALLWKLMPIRVSARSASALAAADPATASAAYRLLLRDPLFAYCTLGDEQPALRVVVAQDAPTRDAAQALLALARLSDAEAPQAACGSGGGRANAAPGGGSPAAGGDDLAALRALGAVLSPPRSVRPREQLPPLSDTELLRALRAMTDLHAHAVATAAAPAAEPPTRAAAAPADAARVAYAFAALKQADDVAARDASAAAASRRSGGAGAARPPTAAAPAEVLHAFAQLM